MRIKELCAQKGVSIEELAKEINIHPQSLRRIISTNNTKPSTIEAIAKALGVTVAEVHGDKPGFQLIALDEHEWCIMKMIMLNIPTMYGPQDVAYFMYKRPLTPWYKLTQSTESVSFVEEYPRQKDFPHDVIDQLVFDSVLQIYPNSRILNKLVIFNTERDLINQLMEPPTQEGKIIFTPFITPDDIKKHPGRTYYRYELPINFYMNFPYKDYRKYFFASYSLNDESAFEKRFPELITL